jgi:hypothetical protein
MLYCWKTGTELAAAHMQNKDKIPKPDTGIKIAIPE